MVEIALNHYHKIIDIMTILTRRGKAWAIAAMAMLSATQALAADTMIRLKNTLGFDRTDELVEVALPQGADAASVCLKGPDGAVVPFEATDKGTILFLATVPMGSTVAYTLAPGTPAKPEKLTCAAVKSPGSRDDIAWENDLAAYRMYSGTLLKNEPNTGNGVDLWQKKMAKPVIDDMYKQSNYHNESAYGVDAYSVNGRRLGAGGVSHVVDGAVATHNPHDSWQVKRDGLLRSEFEVVYENVDVNGVKYKKTLTIETSAGSMLNKATVRYDGPAATLKLAVALYMHTDMSGDFKSKTYTSTPGLIGLAEQPSEGSVTSPGARFYAGAYIPGRATESTILNDHLVVTCDYTPGTDLTYYFGGGWNIFPAGAYPSDEDWFDALERFRKKADSPIAETSATSIPNREDVLNLIYNVNRHWQETNPTHGDYFWNRAVYHTGNMAAYKATGEEDFRAYSEAWAVRNNWKGSTGTDKSRWKYTYGEGPDYVLFGDNQVCFQIYADLYNLDPADYKIARALEVMDHQMSTDYSGYWWWVDGLYMVMPVMTRLYAITGEQRYLDKMYEYWRWATDLMWDDEEHLYYRDGSYVFPGWSIKVGDDPTPRKDFWARGAGWIFAAFGRVLDDLPATDPHRDEYILYYRQMAQALKAAQQPEGHWTRSILEPDYATGYETSGTALFLAGYLWGINHGILSDKDYGQVVEKAWNYLTTIAIQPDNSVGYVQPIGSKAEPGVVISAGQTADFGTGAFLLAASEMVDYAAGDADITALRLSTVKLEAGNRISVGFNDKPAAAMATDPSHYLIDAKPVSQAEIAYDGDRTVTITLPEPLEYGRYVFEATGLKSEAGGDLAADQKRTLIRTVPLTAAPAGMTVTAIGAQAGNPAANAIDNNIGTRWSQSGLKQWICFDLGSAQKVKGVDVAFYAGASRRSFFDVEISADGETFATVLEGCESSGLTNEMERYKFAAAEARYVRLMCNGNSQGGDNWNSITEARVWVDIDNSEIGEIDMPAVVWYDVIMPEATSTGLPITWVSSRPEVLSETGIVHSPADADALVAMTAYVGDATSTIDVLVPKRDPERALMARYCFETFDLLADGKVRDYSPRRNDAQALGSAAINGKLDLTANTNAGFATNGYLLAPQGMLDSLRSYTFMADINAASLEHQPRVYDFGSGSGNSVFLRAEAMGAGVKYNGGTTVVVPSQTPLATGKDYRLAVTFDAATHTTTIIIDGEVTAQSDAITAEPYMLARVAKDARNYIGRTQWWDAGVKGDNVDFQGTIDNFRLYATALTPEEIARVYATEGITSVEAASEALLAKNVVAAGELVEVNAEGPVAVYSISGALVKMAHGSFAADMVAGLYVVRADNRAAKLLVR